MTCNDCVAVRFRDRSSTTESSNKRYVITNPPSDFNLLPSDQVTLGSRLQSVLILLAGVRLDAVWPRDGVPARLGRRWVRNKLTILSSWWTWPNSTASGFLHEVQKSPFWTEMIGCAAVRYIENGSRQRCSNANLSSCTITISTTLHLSPMWSL